MDIKWQEGVVCFSDGECHHPSRRNFVVDSEGFTTSFLNIMNYSDFQLNTIKQGDYIEASELDTEQKYNDAVEVLELSGFERAIDYSCLEGEFCNLLVNSDSLIVAASNEALSLKRKITFNQLMAIGELKRLELARSAPKIAPNLTPNLTPDLEKDGSKYHREIIGLDGVKTTVDVYRVLDAFKTDCAATDHAIKKMLCAGLRGHKDKLTDYDNAIESLQAAKELLMQKRSNENTN